MKKLIGLFNSLIRYFHERNQKLEASVLLDRFMKNVDETIEEIKAKKSLLDIERKGLNFESIQDEVIELKLIAEKTEFDRLMGERGSIMELKEKAKEACSDYVPDDLVAFKGKLCSLGHILIKRKLKAHAKLYAIDKLIASVK